MAKTLYLLRHCAIPENELGINGSRTDSDLSQNGQLAAKELVPVLSRYTFDLIFTSPLKRTRQTIQPYLDSLKNPPLVLTDPLTNERDIGIFTNTISGDGTIAADIAKQGGNRTAWQPQDGESIIQVALRAQQFLTILKSRPENSILISSHQVFLRCLELLIAEKPIDDLNFYADNPARLKPGEMRILSI